MGSYGRPGASRPPLSKNVDAFNRQVVGPVDGSEKDNATPSPAYDTRPCVPDRPNPARAHTDPDHPGRRDGANRSFRVPDLQTRQGLQDAGGRVQGFAARELLWEAIGDPPPNAASDAAAYAEWVVKDQRAYARLMTSADLHHLPTVQGCSSAREAWDALEELFTAQNNARRLQLGKELAWLKINTAEGLMAHSGRTKKLQAAMNAAGHPIDTNTALLHFLMGIGSEYEMEKKILTNSNAEIRWNTTLRTLYPVEEAAAEAATTSEGPAAAAFATGTVRDTPPAWPRGKPMTRAERRRRVVCWSCRTRGHYAHELPTTTDRPQGSGGGPFASFMATGSRPRVRFNMDGAPDEIKKVPGGSPSDQT